MGPEYLSALAALAGSTIGGLTSLTASWLSQHVQFTAQREANAIRRREELYGKFIDEASKLFADAYEHNAAEGSKLVELYALISKMRIVSSPRIVEHADQVARTIIETYLGPNRTFADVVEVLDKEALNPLRAFSNACREELREHGSTR